MAEHGGEHGGDESGGHASPKASHHSSEGGIIGGAGELMSNLFGGFVRDSVEPGPITSWLGAEGGGKGKTDKPHH